MVYMMVYTMVYMMVYTLLCIMVYILVYTTLRLMVYTMIYIMVYTMIWLIHTTLRYRDCTGQHARTYCSQPHATATASYRRALHNGVACVLMNISQAGLQTGAVASCVQCVCSGQCYAAASAMRQGCVQSISGAPSRTPNTVSLM